MSNTRTATVNVGCVGVFKVTAYEEGGWEIVLNDTDGDTHQLCLPELRGDVVHLQTGEFTGITLPVWMWDALMDKVVELDISMKRGSNVSPMVAGAA